MKDITITDTIKYIGADDKDIDLFESQYVVPNGVSYNSYVILDEKVAVMDTVDSRRGGEWMKNLDAALAGRSVDYLVVSHMEPDHAANVQALAEKYPEMKVVGNAKTFPMIAQFFDIDLSQRSVVVAEGDTLLWYIGQRSWYLMRVLRKFSFQQMDLESLAPWTQKKTGHVRRDAIILTLWENMAHKCRRC